MTVTPRVQEIYHVFLSCPNDMAPERAQVWKFFESFNKSVALPFNVRFEVIDWDNSVDIGLQNPQDLITEQTLERYADSLALVIGLMGQRFGSPTREFESGTEAEFEWAAKYKTEHGHPEIKWFFRRIDEFKATPKSKDIQKALEQWRKVKAFKKRFRHCGLYKEFTSVADFSDVLREDLSKWFAEWISKKRVIQVERNFEADSTKAERPSFLKDRLERTIDIVNTLRTFLNDDSEADGLQIRICAVLSSLAITRDDAWQRGDERYLDLLIQERDLLEQLFEVGASLKVLLTWNIDEMLAWPSQSREDVQARLKRLREFASITLQDEERLQRAQLVHMRVRERNLLFLGGKYFYEGRKLSTRAGFEATQLITSKRRISQEREMFDIMFRNAIRREIPPNRPNDDVALNRFLLESLINRIEGDIIRLETQTNDMGERAVSIIAVPNDEYGHTYQAVAGDRHGGGKTPGEAIDAIVGQFDDLKASALVVFQNHLPDQFFTAEQRDRLEELMRQWRRARDSGTTLPLDEQTELDELVQGELRAAGKRAEAMVDELAK